MRKKCILIGTAAVFLLLNSLFSYAEDRITWTVLDFPPVHIWDGPYAGKGYADFVMQLLVSSLDGYRHEFLKCNMARSVKMFREQEKVAHPAILKKDDRDSYIEFSIPAYVLIPNGVIIPKHQADKLRPYINDDGAFLLEKAIALSDLKVGVSVERAYGGVIDEILMKYKNHKNICVSPYEELLKNLFKMMKIGRIDYIIGYPIEAEYFSKNLGIIENIICLPIEGMPEYFLGYIGLPKNEWGKTAVKKINSVLKSSRNTPEYHAAYEFWPIRAKTC